MRQRVSEKQSAVLEEHNSSLYASVYYFRAAHLDSQFLRFQALLMLWPLARQNVMVVGAAHTRWFGNTKERKGTARVAISLNEES